MRKPVFKKLLVLGLCLCIVLAAFISLDLISRHSNHECTHDHCGICLQLGGASHFLAQLRMANIAAFFVLAQITLALWLLGLPLLSHEAVSPVALRVRLNN
ncbi:hypothetical protein U6B65_01140 [Oscillospiraceae bacterium MB08-C2-2]|nr:hypothetical protein U6B65_01140 [Oscillospiraceae bacterium MB08-C2-2]